MVAAVEHGEKRTTIRFGPSMAGRYQRDSVVIYGNVAAASHGESVAHEILGDGDAAQAFQSFLLKKLPVTYVPEPGAPGGVASTLKVRVDGVLWTEVPELYGQPADARVYMARRDDVQKTRVRPVTAQRAHGSRRGVATSPPTTGSARAHTGKRRGGHAPDAAQETAGSEAG